MLEGSVLVPLAQVPALFPGLELESFRDVLLVLEVSLVEQLLELSEPVLDILEMIFVLVLLPIFLQIYHFVIECPISNIFVVLFCMRMQVMRYVTTPPITAVKSRFVAF